MISSEPGVECLLDTNIIIYLTKGDEDVGLFIDGMSGKVFGISVMSYMEALMGIGGPEDLIVLDAVTEHMIMVSFTESIARKSANALRVREKRSVRDPLFADVVIANTAMELGIPLVTNNPKDFSKFTGLKILTPKRRH